MLDVTYWLDSASKLVESVMAASDLLVIVGGISIFLTALVALQVLTDGGR